ncbi:hypothetical protein EWM64_g1716 [Hericium alpestre]|uniref:Uncharacterized protein n=1 Tax=Hericium alpestre TaxID=135208 RepID=A0A4Z0A5H3_9AGAM|nr:hypothetical protein EWM64_g1716 [Hericium alpestre]
MLLQHKKSKQVPQKRTHDSQSDSVSNNNSDRSTKRPKKDEDIDLIVEYRLAGRGLIRIISAFGNVKQICAFAAARANAEAAGTLDAFAKSYRRLDAKTQKSYLQLYDEILDFIPGFCKIVEGGGKNAALVQKLIKAVNKGMEGAKSDDRSDFKADMGDYLPLDATTAYIFIQVRFALTSKERWNPEDRSYKYEEAYGKVVALFEYYPNDPWVLDTLAWYNKQVFGNENGQVDDDSNAESEHDDDDALDMQTAVDAAAAAAVEIASIDAAAAAAEATYDDYEDDDNDGDPQARRAAAASSATVIAQAGTTASTYEETRLRLKTKRRIVEYADTSDEEDSQSRGRDRLRDKGHEQGGSRGAGKYSISSRASLMPFDVLQASPPLAPPLPASPLTQPALTSIRSTDNAVARGNAAGLKARIARGQLERAPFPMAVQGPGTSKNTSARRKKNPPARVQPR